MLLLMWILAATAFILDRWRVPVVPLIVVISLLLYKTMGMDHLFRMTLQEGDSGLSITETFHRRRILTDQFLEDHPGFLSHGRGCLRVAVASGKQ